jgi:hypothetical protein
VTAEELREALSSRGPEGATWEVLDTDNGGLLATVREDDVHSASLWVPLEALEDELAAPEVLERVWRQLAATLEDRREGTGWPAPKPRKTPRTGGMPHN